MKSEQNIGLRPHFFLKSKSTLISFFLRMLALSLLCVSPSWAGGGPLHGDASNYFEHTLVPLLIKEKLCNSKEDCGETHNYFFFAISWSESIDFDLYDITDERVIKEILLSMLNSGLRISRITFWRSKFHEQSFFEKPLVEFIDRTGGK